MTVRASAAFLVGGMLLTGCMNSLLNKYQDMQCVENCDDPDPSKREYFEQPVYQTVNMFIGEMGCLIPIYLTMLLSSPLNPLRAKGKAPQLPTATTDEEEEDLIEREDGAGKAAAEGAKEMKDWSLMWFWVPALFDICGTTLMNIGLIYCEVSVYQMIRGALVLWVALLSVIFLRRRVHAFQWAALLLVMLGVCLVGLSGALYKRTIGIEEVDPETVVKGKMNPALKTVVGVLLVLFAQVFTASQFVVEEKIMVHYATVDPLLAVGYEGFFGLLTLGLVTPFLYLRYGSSGERSFFNLPQGWHEITSNNQLIWSSFAICFSIAFFNYFGLSVTRTISSTARSLIDTCRTIGIWMASLALGWETWRGVFSLAQLAGFGLLVWGTFIFNELVTPPPFFPPVPASLDPALPPIFVPDDEERHLAAGAETDPLLGEDEEQERQT